MAKKTIETISVDDLKDHPVWQFCSGGELEIEPVRNLPCKSLNERVIGTQVTLADGTKVWALLGNLDPDQPNLSQHFLTLSIEHLGKWFCLARYHDYDFDNCGPAQLSKFLGKPVDHIFPISYDISTFLVNNSQAICGKVEKEPTERLTRAEIIAMSVP